MGPLSKKGWWRRIMLSRFTLAVLVLATVGLLATVYDRYQVEREMYARRQSAAAELQQETARKENLEQKVKYLNNDQGLEAEIRRHFDVALKGEQVVVIVGESSASGTSTSSGAGNGDDQGFWDRWWPW